jgi:hypothetical protein
MPVTYRQLPDEEFERLASIFEQNHAPMPSPGLRTAFVAEDGERIVGMACLQFAAHGEPWWIDPEYRGRVNFMTLAALLNKTVEFYGGRGYLVLAENKETARMCEVGGLEEMKGVRVFRKQFSPRSERVV